MRNKFTIFILVLMTWIVVSLIFHTNKLSSDGFLEFGYPLVVYSSFSGKGQRESLELGINIINLVMTAGFLLLFCLVVLEVIKRIKR